MLSLDNLFCTHNEGNLKDQENTEYIIGIFWYNISNARALDEYLSSSIKFLTKLLSMILTDCIKIPSLPQLIYAFQQIGYIHNWILQAFSQDYSLAFHTTHFVSVLISHASSGTYNVKLTPNNSTCAN